MKHPSVVFDAMARSAPMRYALCLYAGFLPALRTPPAEAHLFRMTGMYLDCLHEDDTDMRPFFNLSLPSLESLELWLDCSTVLRPRNLRTESPARFPSLRSLTTTCVSFPLAWVGASLRTLEIKARAQTPYEARHSRCCHFRSVSQLTTVLEKGPDLEDFTLFGCLLHDETPRWHEDPDVLTRPQSLRLDRLKNLKIGDDVDYVRSILERCALPRDSSLTIYTDSAYDAISKFLPARNPLPFLPLIRQVHLAVCRPDVEDYPHSVLGSSPGANGTYRRRLSVLSTDDSIMRSDHADVDLLRLFQGFAPCFSSAAVVDLSIKLGQPEPAAWVWLLRNFPRITHLSVEASSTGDFFSALEQDDVVPELSTLESASHAHRD